MHAGSPSIPLASSEQSPNPSDWEALEERLFALTDEIERVEGVPIEHAYHLAQMRLGMVSAEPQAEQGVPLSECPDDLMLLPF